MSDTPAETPAEIELVEPEMFTDDEYASVESVLLGDSKNIDPLSNLSTEATEIIVRIAYHDLMALKRLERTVRESIATMDGGSTKRASKFNLNEFKQGAKQRRDQLASAEKRRKELRQRNLRIVGGTDTGDGMEQYADGVSLSTQAKGQSGSSYLRSISALEQHRKGRVWFDDFHGVVFTDWYGGQDDQLAVPPFKIDDAWLLRVHEWLQYHDPALSRASFTTTEKAVYSFSDQDHRNEPRDWMRALKWDGVERLDTLMHEAYGTPQDEYHGAVGRCWFISMAARCCTPGCKVDTMPVFYGPQGTFKSTSLEVIGGPWYATINTTAANNDFLLALRGVLVAEIAELDAISERKVENSRVKTLLSTRVDRYRSPYGRTTQDHPRTAVLAASTNDPGWHRDATGGRRFWPINCQGLINVAWLRDNRGQLFAEAIHRLDAGEGWDSVPREAQDKLVDEHYTADPWIAQIERAIASWGTIYTGGLSTVRPVAGDAAGQTFEEQWGTLVTTNRLATLALQLSVERQTRVTSIRIAEAMRALGWYHHRVRVNTPRGAVFVRCWARDDVTELGGVKEPELPIEPTA